MSFRSAGFFVLRTPLLPLSAFVDWSAGLAAGDRAGLRERLRVLLIRPEVREALFVASPVLEESLALWMRDPESERGQKAERSLVRYLARMAGRATPFGLFAGCSVGRLAEATRLEVDELRAYRRRTRLDMEYVSALCDALAAHPDLRGELTYRPSSSLYSAPGELRYVEARLAGRIRTYHLVTVEATPYLTTTLERASRGARPAELARALAADDPEVPPGDVEAFVRELIDAQVLVPDLAPAVTGADPLRQLVLRLASHPEMAQVTAVLEQAGDDIDLLDRTGLGNAPESYRKIAARLESLPAKVELPRLFQVDMVTPASTATLGPEVLGALADLVRFLHRTAERSDPLADFKREFARRYEEREVPLVQVLDEETGIGFDPGTGPASDPSPLLAGLPFGGGAYHDAAWNERESLLFGKLEEALREGAHEVVLDQADLDKLATRDPPPLPDSFAVMATLMASSPEAIATGDFRMLVHGVVGPSGATMLGRFCHADPALEARVRALVAAEESHHPDALYAEIVHLPEGRTGNVIARPVLRGHEIPYLGVSGAPDDRQIPVTDLWVKVVDDRVVLRSARLGREVIPRLTNAHNFSNRTVGTYRFLCTVARQGVAELGLGWGAVRASFLPRLVHGRYVLARASWTLGRHDLDAIKKGELQELRRTRRLPRFVQVADHDNLLPVDFDNALSVDSFVHLCKSQPSVKLEELLPSVDELCASCGDQRFAHELVVPFTRDPAPKQTPKRREPTGPTRTIARRLAPGSEWLYAKLYCGPATCDRVLRDTLAPLVAELEAAGAFDRWFFIRYGDPDHHLRLRFGGTPDRLMREVLPALNQAAAPLLEEGLLWRVQLDTYEREIERYGGPDGMLASERVFHEDSRACLGIVSLLTGEEGAIARWQLALFGMDLLLDDLGFDLAQKRELVQATRKSFGAEFGVDAPFEKALGDKYRKEREALWGLFDPAAETSHPFAPGLALLRARSLRLQPTIAELRRLGTRLPDVAASLLHMHANRLLRSNPRAQELAIYDLLSRMYESQAARLRRPARENAVNRQIR